MICIKALLFHCILNLPPSLPPLFITTVYGILKVVYSLDKHNSFLHNEWGYTYMYEHNDWEVDRTFMSGVLVEMRYNTIHCQVVCQNDSMVYETCKMLSYSSFYLH